MRRRDFFQRTQQRRYANRSRENPYFRGKGNRRKLRFLFTLISFCFLLLASIGVLFAHPIFNLTAVHVKGIQHIERTLLSSAIKQSMSERIGLFFHRQNRFLFSEERFLGALNAQFTFRDVQLKRTGRRLELMVVERTSQLIWSTGSLMFVVDLDGVAIRQLDEEEFEQFKRIGMPLFVDRNAVEIQMGQAVLKPEEIEAVFRFHEHLSVQHIAFSQTEFDRLSGKWIGVLTAQHYRILFDVTGDIDAQSGRLEIILKEKVSDPSKLEYIDLRFGDHVYLK